MGCIEIQHLHCKTKRLYSLIETWDVLKFWYARRDCPVLCSLIETWDVLKFVMHVFVMPFNPSLIETWDVLKFKKYSSVFLGLFSLTVIPVS